MAPLAVAGTSRLVKQETIPEPSPKDTYLQG